MKVCLLNDSFPPVIDGVANVVQNYASILTSKELAEVVVATPKYPGADYDSYPYKVIPYSSFDTTKIVKGYRAGNPLDLRELRDLSEFGPDIIHTHCPVASGYMARLLRHKIDAPIVFTYHTKFDEDIARAVRTEFIRKETVKFLVNNIEACDEVWVVSEGAGENLRSLGYNGEYKVASNGVDFARGRVSADKVHEVTKDYDLPENVPVFLFVGRIIAYKGIGVILDACAKMKEKGKDFRMVFVGKGPDEDIFKMKAETLGLLNNGEIGRCIFTGPIYDRDILRAWNTRANLFIFPSTYDTNGIVVREAAACGLASVLIKGSCAAEGITDGRNGFLVDKSDDAICELLCRIGSDFNLMSQVGQNAMDEIYISWESSVEVAHQRYSEIIEKKRSGQLKTKRSTISDYFANIPETIARDTQAFFRYQASVLDNMKESVAEIKEDIEKNIRRIVK